VFNLQVMMISNSLVPLFYQNINGSLEKLGILEKFFSSYEIVCISEHLQSAYNVSQLELSRDRMLFFRPAKLTSGRSSGGLAIAVNKKFFALFLNLPMYIFQFILVLLF